MRLDCVRPRNCSTPASFALIQRPNQLLKQRIYRLFKPGAKTWNDFGENKIPEKELHKERNISKDLDIGSTKPRQKLSRKRSNYPDDRTNNKRQYPRGNRQDQGPLKADEQKTKITPAPVKSRFQEDAPIQSGRV